MLVLHLVIASVMCLGILISNLLTVLLIGFVIFQDIDSNPQGADYYIFSLAVTDLIIGFLLIPLSMFSFAINEWIFGEKICAFYAHLWNSLWLINTYVFLLLSFDRYSYVTNKKYAQYKTRTRVRCICDICFALSIACLYSFVPPSLLTGRLSTVIIDQHICTVYWHSTSAYYSTVIVITVLPTLFGSMYAFAKIFYWRIQYGARKMKRKLTGDRVELLLDPAHRMSLIMVLVFWSSWIPFGVQIYWHLYNTFHIPSAYAFWLGGSQGMWKFPIMMIFCPRYRQYLNYFRCTKIANEPKANLEKPALSVEQLQTDDTELHM